MAWKCIQKSHEHNKSNRVKPYLKLLLPPPHSFQTRFSSTQTTDRWSGTPTALCWMNRHSRHPISCPHPSWWTWMETPIHQGRPWLSLCFTTPAPSSVINCRSRCCRVVQLSSLIFALQLYIQSHGKCWFDLKLATAILLCSCAMF